MRHFDLGSLLPDEAHVLCIGAHSDDIEIGAGGTIAHLLRTREDLAVTWVVCSAKDVRDEEARNSAQFLLQNCRQPQLIIKDFRNGYFPYAGASLKEFFEDLKQLRNPDIIFTHCRHDLHQDHRVVSELTWNTFRDHCIFEFEVPKFDGDLGAPNAFISLSMDELEAKIETLMGNFNSQHSKPWFTADTFTSLARLRGNECNSSSGFAEAFYCRKIILA